MFFVLAVLLNFHTANAAGTMVSSNWSGYVATSGSYTTVSGKWTVPQATDETADLAADVTWVGIGGVSGSDLIQAGTHNFIQNGTSTYGAWYELLPASLVEVPLAVHPGDVMAVSITQQSSGQWLISFRNNTSGQSYQTSVSYTSSLSSAEWIEEMPSSQYGLIPLDDFGTVSFFEGYAIKNGAQYSISGAAAEPVTMVTNGEYALATPSALGSDGSSFTVTRNDTTVTTTTTSSSTVTDDGFPGVGFDVRSFIPQSDASSSFQFSMPPQTVTINRYFHGNLGDGGMGIELRFLQENRMRR